MEKQGSLFLPSHHSWNGSPVLGISPFWILGPWSPLPQLMRQWFHAKGDKLRGFPLQPPIKCFASSRWASLSEKFAIVSMPSSRALDVGEKQVMKYIVPKELSSFVEFSRWTQSGKEKKRSLPKSLLSQDDCEHTQNCALLRINSVWGEIDFIKIIQWVTNVINKTITRLEEWWGQYPELLKYTSKMFSF